MGPAAPEHATSDDVVAVSGSAWLAVAKASAAGTVVLRKQDLPAYGDAEDKTLILVEDAPLRRTLELFAPEEDVPAPGVRNVPEHRSRNIPILTPPRKVFAAPRGGGAYYTCVGRAGTMW